MGVRGIQRPRLEWIPPAGRFSDAGKRAIDLCGEIAGLRLDEWQQYVLDSALRRRPDGLWAAFEVALIVSRQNGKGAILEARELAGLFLDERDGFGDERLILHSAHEFKTASEAFRRVLMLIQDSSLLSRQVKHVYLQRGQESIELKSGKRLRFVARSSGSGRGFSGDLIILDEAQVLGNEAMEALLPTLSARPNPQVLYTATAGNLDSTQLGRIRARGLTGNDPSLAFFEWSAEDGDDPADLATWVKANPGLGIRITADYVERERATLSAEGFARERLSIGDYPTGAGGDWAVVSEDAWDACRAPGPVAL
jgi:phage terminase large subunit-like protein